MQVTSISKFQRWSVLSLLNLFIVSFLGVLLRYKITFSLPAVNYNFLLQAHSHFAFSGWISTAIFTSLVYILFQSGFPIGRTYSFQFCLAQIASFGMLFSFSFEGYGVIAIFFSLLFILFAWWFAFQYWKDANRSDLPFIIKIWAKAALFFLVFSTVATFFMAYMKLHHFDIPDLYYSTSYFFLHFQYNGWFTFGVLSLFFFTAHKLNAQADEMKTRLFFIFMVAACIPAYTLSLLWMNPLPWVFMVAATAACLQLVAMWIFLLLVRSTWLHWNILSSQVKLIWGLSFIALMGKLILQALSAIPALGRIAFGFRPVIIAYLHMIMLCFISFFLIGFFIKEKLISACSFVWKLGLLLFISGVMLNEVFLLTEAFSAIKGGNWQLSSLFLFFVESVILGGTLLMFFSQLHKSFRSPLFSGFQI